MYFSDQNPLTLSISLRVKVKELTLTYRVIYNTRIPCHPAPNLCNFISYYSLVHSIPAKVASLLFLRHVKHTPTLGSLLYSFHEKCLPQISGFISHFL